MERQITVNGTILNAAERGGGETDLVFLHFYGGSGRTWSEVIDRLESDFRCIALDLRGCGASPPAPDGDYSVDANAADIVGLIEQMGLRRYLLVGHSMGGKFALAVAARLAAQAGGAAVPQPAALVLLAPSPPSPEPMTDADRESARNGQGNPVAAAETLKKITGKPITLPIALRTIEDMVGTSRAAWLAWLDNGSKEDISDRMFHISAPVLVLSGSRDSVIPVNVLQRELIGRLSNASLAIVPEVGHLLPLEAADVVAESIRGAD